MSSTPIEPQTLSALRAATVGPREPDEDADCPAIGPVVLEVTVAGLPQRVKLEPDALLEGYVPLMRILIDRHRTARRRIVAGLAGIPGSGKSTLTAVLAELWRHVRPGPTLAAIGMDGWHLTNAELERRTFVDADGATMPLRLRKGSPDSFDVRGLTDALRRIRGASDEVRVPVYDRNLHEPVPDAAVIAADADIVLVEGNYLLSDDGSWAEVSRQIDLGLWLEIDPAACRDGLISRHVAGGMSPTQAAEKYRRNDRPNAEFAQAGRPRSAWIIDADPEHAILAVRRA